MIDAATTIIVIIGIFAAIAGAYGAIIGVYSWMGKHIAAKGKHPCTENIVFKDVCNEKMGRIEDCVEEKIKNLDEKITDLKIDLKTDMIDLKTDMKEGFDRVERAILAKG